MTIAYDNRRRISTVTDVFGQTVGYSYDADGNRTQLTIGGAINANYQYDVLNRLTQLTDAASLAFTFAYDATNKLTSRAAPNGVVSSYQYDGLDRLTRLTHAKGTNTIADFQYQFNATNNITQIVDAAGTHNYSYDALDRLTAATHPNQPNESYTYDDVGNRTASHQGSSYSYQAFNRLTLANGTSYAYDANGNLTSKTDVSGSWNYSWDSKNRLKQAALPGGVTVNYSYDALGRRIQRSNSNGSTSKFVYDGDDVVLDLNSNLSVSAEYVNGLAIDNKLRQYNAGAMSYFASDHIGSTRVLTDPSGNLSSSQDYDSFGTVSSGSVPTRFAYTGRESDSETGMLHYRARLYYQREGRFVSEDSIEPPEGDVNLYAYVGNNPANYVDPRGLERLRYVLEPGKPPPPLPPANPVRLPDFYSGQVNVGPPGVPFGWSGQLILDRHGHIYLQLLGFNFGKSVTAFSGALTMGWINQRCEPDEKKLHDVLSDQSTGFGGGYLLGGEVTGNQSGSTTQVGFMTPQIGYKLGLHKSPNTV